MKSVILVEEMDYIYDCKKYLKDNNFLFYTKVTPRELHEDVFLETGIPLCNTCIILNKNLNIFKNNDFPKYVDIKDITQLQQLNILEEKNKIKILLNNVLVVPFYNLIGNFTVSFFLIIKCLSSTF